MFFLALWHFFFHCMNDGGWFHPWCRSPHLPVAFVGRVWAFVSHRCRIVQCVSRNPAFDQRCGTPRKNHRKPCIPMLFIFFPWPSENRPKPTRKVVIFQSFIFQVLSNYLNCSPLFVRPKNCCPTRRAVLQKPCFRPHRQGGTAWQGTVDGCFVGWNILTGTSSVY